MKKLSLFLSILAAFALAACDQGRDTTAPKTASPMESAAPSSPMTEAEAPAMPAANAQAEQTEEAAPLVAGEAMESAATAKDEGDAAEQTDGGAPETGAAEASEAPKDEAAPAEQTDADKEATASAASAEGSQ